MTITIRDAVGAYVEAFQRADANLAELGNPPPQMYDAQLKAARPDPFYDCLRRPVAWTIERPSVFTLDSRCAEVKLTCGTVQRYGAAHLEQRGALSWFIAKLEPGRCR